MKDALDMAILADHPAAADICRERLLENGIPNALQAGLVRYLVDGIRPGSFLSAVLENDLREAVVRANPDEHLLALPALVRFLFTEAPSASHGDKVAVARWCERRRQ